jgi:copper chaperone CopZ
MKIEVLYFDGCPNHKPTVERVREVLQQEGISAEVSEVHIRDDAAAQAAGFLGSPSIRVNALDMEPAARSLKDFGMMCRTYAEHGRRVGLPPRELIQAALQEAVGWQPTHDCCQVPAVPTPLSEPVAPKRKWLLGGSVTAAVAASLCCILPILTAATGVGILAAGARFESWRPYLLGVTGLLLGTGLFLAYRDYKKACAPGSLCATKPMSRWNLAALGMLTVLVAGLAAFPYYSGAVARVVLRQPDRAYSAGSVGLPTVMFRIPDMDCPACAVSLEATLRKLPGVADAKLDVDSRKAVVTYDPAAQNVVALEKAITEAGFHIAPASHSM